MVRSRSELTRDDVDTVLFWHDRLAQLEAELPADVVDDLGRTAREDAGDTVEHRMNCLHWIGIARHHGRAQGSLPARSGVGAPPWHREREQGAVAEALAWCEEIGAADPDCDIEEATARLARLVGVPEVTLLVLADALQAKQTVLELTDADDWEQAFPLLEELVWLRWDAHDRRRSYRSDRGREVPGGAVSQDRRRRTRGRG